MFPQFVYRHDLPQSIGRCEVDGQDEQSDRHRDPHPPDAEGRLRTLPFKMAIDYAL